MQSRSAPFECGQMANDLAKIRTNLLQCQYTDAHCHPVLANVGSCKFCKGKHMRMKNDVSESDSGSAFFPAADMPNWRYACWKIDFFATDGVDSSRTISPLRGTL